MSNIRSHRGVSLKQAVAAVVEGLEQRMLLAAGQLDPSFGGGAGFIFNGQTFVPFDIYDTTTNHRQHFAFWDSRVTTNTGSASLYDLEIDAGGKILAVGTELGRKLFLAANDLTITNPESTATPPATETTRTYEDLDLDVNINRYFANGENDGYHLRLGDESWPVWNPGDRDYFSNAGPYPIPNASNANDHARAIAVDPFDNSIVIAGTTDGIGGGGTQLLLARYVPRLNMIKQLVLMTGSQIPWSINDMVIQPDGNILVAGSTGDGFVGADFTVWRFNGRTGAAYDLTLDTNDHAGTPADPNGGFGPIVGTNGDDNSPIYLGYNRINFATKPDGSNLASDDEAMKIALEPQTLTDAQGRVSANPNAGAIVAIGYEDDSTWSSTGIVHMVVTRYTSMGLLDGSFGSSGKLSIGDFGGKNARGTDAVIQPDGRIIVLGAYDASPSLDVGADAGYTPQTMLGGAAGKYDSTVVLRLDANGVTDENNFGARGRAYITLAPTQTWVGQRVGLESSGKLIIAGITNNGLGGGTSAAALRLTADGRLDTNYGAAGFQTLSLGAGNVAVDWYSRVSLAIQPSDDKALIGLNVNTSLVVTSRLSLLNILNGTTFRDGTRVQQSYIARLTSDNRRPRAELQTKDFTISDPTTTNLDIIVTYTDETLIDRTSIDLLNISITGPGIDPASPWHAATMTVVANPDVVVGVNSNSFTVVYHVTIPAGFWGTSAAPLNNGTYTIQIQATDTQVKDTDPVPLAVGAQTLGQFRVNILADPTHDIQPPKATIKDLPFSAHTGNAGVTVGGRTALDFSIRYEDFGGGNVNVGSLSSANLRVRSSTNFFDVPATFMDYTQEVDGSNVVLIARYRILAPGGVWEVSDNGQYQIVMQTGQVSDDYLGAPNFVPAGVVSDFTVAIVPDIDVRPTAALANADGTVPASPITYNAASGFYEFSVLYSTSPSAGNVAMDLATIAGNLNAIRVQNVPLGFNGAAVPFSVRQLTPGDTKNYVVVYRISPVGGGVWAPANNGIYTVSVVGGQVADTDSPQNYIMARQLGSFTIAVGVAPATGITATMVTPPQVNAGSGRATFVVRYTSATPIPTNALGGLPIFEIIGPNYYSQAGAFEFEYTPAWNMQIISPTDVRVTYYVPLPAEEVWTSMDNGLYTIRSLPDTTIDGLPGGQLLGSFRVNIAAAVLVGDELQIAGTRNADAIDVSLLNGKIHTIVNGRVFDFEAGSVQTISVRPGAGNDTVRVQVAKDTMVFDSSGNDTILTSTGNDSIESGVGRDYVASGAGNDTILGGGGQDTLLGQGGSDDLSGEAGADSINGANGDDVIHGGAGGDTLVGGRGVDALFGEDGNDWLYSRDGAVDTLFGGAGVNHGQIDRAGFSVVDDIIPDEDIQDLLA